MRHIAVLVALLPACAAESGQPATSADPEQEVADHVPRCVAEAWPEPPRFEDERWIYSDGTYVFPPVKCVLFRQDKTARIGPEVLLATGCDSYSISAELLHDGWIYFWTAGTFGSGTRHRVRTDGTDWMVLAGSLRGSATYAVGDDDLAYAALTVEIDDPRYESRFHVVDGPLDETNRVFVLDGKVNSLAVHQQVAYFAIYGDGPRRLIRAPFDAAGVASYQTSTEVPEPSLLLIHGGELYVTGRITNTDGKPVRSFLYRGDPEDLSTLAPIAQFEWAAISGLLVDDLGIVVVTRHYSPSLPGHMREIWRVRDDGGGAELLTSFAAPEGTGTDHVVAKDGWVMVAGVRVRRDCPAVRTP